MTMIDEVFNVIGLKEKEEPAIQPGDNVMIAGIKGWVIRIWPRHVVVKLGRKRRYVPLFEAEKLLKRGCITKGEVVHY